MDATSTSHKSEVRHPFPHQIRYKVRMWGGSKISPLKWTAQNRDQKFKQHESN